MSDPLDLLSRSIHNPGDAVRWACVLEATAPKVGNVYPGRSFEDLRYSDFIAAAEIASETLGRSDGRLSQRMFRAVDDSTESNGTNVNLGIVLLLGPLVEADRQFEREGATERCNKTWRSAVHDVLSAFDGIDGQNLFRAIDRASAGGLGEVDSLDVHNTTGPVDIIEAMRLAESRDRIARQYVGGYVDLIESVAPVVSESIGKCGDVLTGISRAQIRLLSLEPDSLIARKNGVEVAIDVQRRAGQVDFDDPASVARFDDSLRSASPRLNPGTTADLIAAALYLLLRTPASEK